MREILCALAHIQLSMSAGFQIGFVVNCIKKRTCQSKGTNDDHLTKQFVDLMYTYTVHDEI